MTNTEKADIKDFFNHNYLIFKPSKMTATEAKAKEILSRKQVARLLDLSTRTVARMTQRGVIKSYIIDDKHYYKFSEIFKSMGIKEEKKAA